MNDHNQHDPIDDVVDHLFSGDDQSAKTALRAAIAASQRAHADQATAGAVERRLEMRSALREFDREHPAVARDPEARNVADRFLAVDLQRHGYSDMDAVPVAELGAFIDRAGSATEDYMRARGAPKAQASDTSAVIERMRLARTGRAPGA